MSLVLLGILNSQVSPAGAPAYDLLETQVLTSSAASVTFTGLGSYTDYKHLQVRASWQTTYSIQRDVLIRFNSDSGANYASHYLQGNGSLVGSYARSSQNQIRLENSVSTISNASYYSGAVVDILDFSSANKNTTVRGLSGDNVTYKNVKLSSGAWFNTSAVTNIEFLIESGYSYSSNSRFSLYGVK